MYPNSAMSAIQITTSIPYRDLGCYLGPQSVYTVFIKTRNWQALKNNGFHKKSRKNRTFWITLKNTLADDGEYYFVMMKFCEYWTLISYGYVICRHKKHADSMSMQ